MPSHFETSLPAAFSLYIATKILQERKEFQAHFNQIQDQSWPDILDFTLLLFMWFNKKYRATVNSYILMSMWLQMSVRIAHTLPASFTSAFCSEILITHLWSCRSWFPLKLFFFFLQDGNMFMVTHRDRDTCCLLIYLLATVATLKIQLRKIEKHSL